MAQKRKKSNPDKFNYSKNDSFENLQVVQEMALNRKGKDDEINPDISVFLKAEELKGKLCGLYSDKDNSASNINLMGSVIIDGKELNVKLGDDVTLDRRDD